MRALVVLYKLILAAFLLLSVRASANYTWAMLGVDGLTCSQCSRSVEMSIRKLSFVQDVEMDLANTEAKITFKLAAKVDIQKIAQAVYDAGFSVRYLSAGFVFDNTGVVNNTCFPFEGNQLQFIKVSPQVLKGEVTLKFIGKKFISAKEYKKWQSSLIPVCDKTKGEILYVTL